MKQSSDKITFETLSDRMTDVSFDLLEDWTFFQ